MNEIQKSLFDTMKQFVDEAVQNSKSTKIIKAKISHILDESICKYEIEYLGQYLEAYSTGNILYQIGDKVNVILPEGDISAKRIILSLIDPSSRGEGGTGSLVGISAIPAQKIRALF